MGGLVGEWVRPPCVTLSDLLFLYGALDSRAFFTSRAASGRCVLSAAAAGVPAGVVSAFAHPPPPPGPQ